MICVLYHFFINSPEWQLQVILDSFVEMVHFYESLKSDFYCPFAVNHLSMNSSTPCDITAYLYSSWCWAFSSNLIEVHFVHRFANAPEAARMDWSAFTKGYFLNRETLVAVLLLIDASVPPQKIDLDCANWLGRNNVCSYPISILFPIRNTYTGVWLNR